VARHLFLSTLTSTQAARVLCRTRAAQGDFPTRSPRFGDWQLHGIGKLMITWLRLAQLLDSMGSRNTRFKTTGSELNLRTSYGHVTRKSRR
jgi:hypothetical protein